MLRDPENTIPFTAAGMFLQASAVRTGCEHFGLLLGQRSDTRNFGLVGSLMRNAPTLGQALQDLVDNQRRYVRGSVPYLVVRNDVAWVGFAILQRVGGDLVGLHRIVDDRQLGPKAGDGSPDRGREALTALGRVVRRSSACLARIVFGNIRR